VPRTQRRPSAFGAKPHRSGIRRQGADQEIDQGRLAAAVRPHDADAVAALDAGRERCNDRALAVALAEILGLDPTFPLKYMVYFLIVVTVGGTSSITGPFAASLVIGIADVAGKYYVPKFGAFVIYTIMIIVLILRPQGLFARAAGR